MVVELLDTVVAHFAVGGPHRTVHLTGVTELELELAPSVDDVVELLLGIRECI